MRWFAEVAKSLMTKYYEIVLKTDIVLNFWIVPSVPTLGIQNVQSGGITSGIKYTFRMFYRINVNACGDNKLTAAKYPGTKRFLRFSEKSLGTKIVSQERSHTTRFATCH